MEERQMSDLIVVGFHGKHRAAEVLDQLQQLDDKWVIDLEDGVAAYRRDNGKLRVDQSLTLTGKQGGTLGATLGLLVGGLLAAPFTGGVLQPGDSAIFALLRTHDRDVAAKYFARYGGTVLQTTLSPTKEAQLQETIRA
jgi:uncharacterized membrane protein